MRTLSLSMLLVGLVGFLMLSTGCTHPAASQKAMNSEAAMQNESGKMMQEEAPMAKEGETMM